MSTKEPTPKEKAYQRFVSEAENFFVTKFISSAKIKETYSFCLDVLFELEKNPDVDYSRGIILFSPKYGQGKSFFFDVVHHRFKRLKNQQPFVMTTAKELVRIFIEEGEDALLRAISVTNLFIDDIGDEGEKKDFQRSKSKNTLNVIRWVLLKRYEFWVKKSWRTFGTTNLSLNEIQDEYDGRVSDRLEQMVHWIPISFLNSGTFRQQKASRKLTKQEIQANYEKLKPVQKEPEFTVNVVQYMNELIEEPDEYIKGMGWVSWSFVKKQLLEFGIIKETDFIFDEETLANAEFVLRQDTIASVKFMFRDTDREVRIAERERRNQAIGEKEIQEMASTILAKQVFLNLRTQKFVFNEPKNQPVPGGEL